MPSADVYLALVIVLGVAAQVIASRLRLPAILLLLAFGFAAGFFWTSPDNVLGTEVLFAIVSLSVAVILFEGGMSLQFSDLNETREAVLRLITIGCGITWILGTAAGFLVFEDVRVAALAGAIYTVTGPTVIVPLLRHVRPTRRVGSLAKWEGIVIDPVGAILAVLVFEAVLAGPPGAAATAVLAAIARTMVVSLVFTLVAATFVVVSLRRRWVPDHLDAVALLVVVLATHSLSNMVQAESGLATVTLLGIALANQRFVRIEHLAAFKEHLSVLLISTLFILLASRIEPRDFAMLGLPGLAFLAVLIVLVRPAAVFGSLIGSSVPIRERAFLAWLAPRGIVAASVSSVFALHVLEAYERDAVSATIAAQMDELVALTFLVIVGTVAVYGLTAGFVARRLGVADPNPQGILFVGADEVGLALAGAVAESGYVTKLIDLNRENVRNARMEGFRTRQGNALSGAFRQSLDLGGIGRLLAVTPNDLVNTLACMEFANAFGRSEVYQLAQPAESETKPTSEETSERFRGRTLFHKRLDHDALQARLAAGSIVKTTKLTPEFDYDAFLARYGTTAVPLFVRHTNGDLSVCTSDKPVTPREGQTLIALVDEPVGTIGAETGEEVDESR